MNLDRVAERLSTLASNLGADDSALFQALTREKWAIESLERMSRDEPTTTLARDLHERVLKGEGRELTAALGRLLEAYRSGRRAVSPTARLAAVQAVVTILASITAILVGNLGILPALSPIVEGTGIPPTPPSVGPSGDLPPNIATVLHGLQLVVVVVLLLLLPTQFGYAESRIHPDSEVAKGALHQFKAGWRSLWTIWALFYGWMAVKSLAAHLGWPTLDARVEHSVSDLLNCASSIAFFWCFLVLDLPSVATASDPKRTEPFHRTAAIVLGLGIASLALSIADRWDQPDMRGLGTLILSFYIGLSMAFMAGRMGSHWMQVPLWMLSLLYLYGLMQVLYALFDVLSAAQIAFVFALALGLKIALFLVVSHLLREGQFAAYLNAASEGKLGPGRG